MAHQRCENCGKDNQGDATYCYSCGHILPVGRQRLATHGVTDNHALKPQLRWGTAYFGDNSILRIHVRDSGKVVETRFHNECILGREVDDAHPDVDLTPYGAVKMGVSRIHVRLTKQTATIMVEDLGSRNGTFLNGERLLPKQPRVLRNEDELRLGRMVMRISFGEAPGTKR
ncbi:MAG: FHA domain-containing protein [Chloroflexi bacterium]|nr:FHA domain-containing protein [Chloroflexota bacterium]